MTPSNLQSADTPCYANGDDDAAAVSATGHRGSEDETRHLLHSVKRRRSCKVGAKQAIKYKCICFY